MSLDIDVRRNNVNDLIKHSNNLLSNLSATNYSIKTEVEQDFPTDSMGLIHIAAYYDSLESFLYLIKMGLSPEMRSGNGVLFIFILHLYIMHVQEQHLKLLLTSYRNSK